jgi:DNA-binding HxlR family transcriptional regulator
MQMQLTSLDNSTFIVDQVLINRALSIIGGKWRLNIILLLSDQTLRYGELNKLLPEISEKVLASELKTLVALGIMNRVVFPETPPRVEYSLTKKGRLALPLFRQVQQIGQHFN